jgi:hypothetical protein
MNSHLKRGQAKGFVPFFQLLDCLFHRKAGKDFSQRAQRRYSDYRGLLSIPEENDELPFEEGTGRGVCSLFFWAGSRSEAEIPGAIAIRDWKIALILLILLPLASANG